MVLGANVLVVLRRSTSVAASDRVLLWEYTVAIWLHRVGCCWGGAEPHSGGGASVGCLGGFRRLNFFMRNTHKG